MGNEGSKPGGAGKGAESDGRGNSYRADEPVNPDGTAGEPIADPSNISELQDSSIAQAPQPKLTKDDFTLIKTIGKGSFGKVLMVKKNDTGKVYAMKVLNKEKVIARKQYEHTLSERKILQDISHPFLVGMHFAFQSTSKLYMVFDFFNGGELYSYVSKGKFNENRARFYTGEIALGIGASVGLFGVERRSWEYWAGWASMGFFRVRGGRCPPALRVVAGATGRRDAVPGTRVSMVPPILRVPHLGLVVPVL